MRGPLLAVAMVLASALSAAGADQVESHMQRITVRDGRFVQAESLTPFEPRGFNYIRLHQAWHSTFMPGQYDGPRASAMLADLAGRGFNVVRVFIDHRAGGGVVSSADATGLSPAYMDNVADFLARAASKRVYVIFTLLEVPQARHYTGDDQHPLATGPNAQYLDPPHLAGKCAYVRDFVQALRDRDASLLSAVMAYELENESHFDVSCRPLDRAEGHLEFAGRTYDLTSEADLQRLVDDAVARWANACTDAIHAVDPQAMVSTNVFTFAAVGRTGPGHLLTDAPEDHRFPARPLALVDTKLAYLDVHLYPLGRPLQVDMTGIEFEAVRDACSRTGKPIIMGEFGAFRFVYPDAPKAAAAMADHLRRVYELGFAGFVYWTYDCDEQEELFNAKSDGGLILDALTPVRRSGG